MYKRQIESKRAYGNFIMEDVSCRALIDASDNGDVKFDNLTSDYIDLKSKNGNIRGNINGAQTEYIICLLYTSTEGINAEGI